MTGARAWIALPMMPSHHYVELAPLIESCGYEGIAVPDSVFYPREVSAKYPFSEDGERFWSADTPFLDPFIAIAAMGAVTSRVRFLTNVLKVSLRHPLLVAKQVSSLQALTHDRLILGLGLSWIPEEFSWCGTEKSTRGARLDEAIEILRSAGSGRWTSFHGKHYQFGELKMSPAGQRELEIAVGGHSEAALARAARSADGWISAVCSTVELGAFVDRLGDLRPPDQPALKVFGIANDVYDGASFRRLGDAGVTDILCCPWYFAPGDPNDLNHQREQIERFAAELGLLC